MCRSQELGGRRCPAHSDPVKREAYNAIRRSRYASAHPKALEGPTGLPELLDDASLFPSFDEVRYSFNKRSENWGDYIEEAEKFKSRIEEYEEDIDARRLKRALKMYTSDDYISIRDFLNGYQMASTTPDKPLNFSKAVNERLSKQVESMDAVLNYAEPPAEPRTVYRGMNIPMSVDKEKTGEWLENHFPVGGVISQKSYMSTSLDPTHALRTFASIGVANSEVAENRGVVIEIITKQGAALTDGTSDYGTDEAEILMPREAKFKVVAVHKRVEYNISLHPSKKLADSGKANAAKMPYKRTVIQLVDVSEEN